MDPKLKYITLKTSTLTNAPIIKFPINPKESITRSAHRVLMETCYNPHERFNLLNKPLHVRLGNLNLSHKQTDHTLESLQLDHHNDIEIYAEHEPENFYNYFDVLRFHTPTAADVQAFKGILADLMQNEHYVDVWAHAKAGKFADVKLPKNVVLPKSNLKIEKHGEDLLQKVRKTFCATGDGFHHRFHPTDEIIQYLGEIQQRFSAIPGMKSVLFTIGKTTEGKDIVGISLMRENASLKERPKILAIGGVHAREWVGISTNLYLMEKMLDQSDREMQHILSHCEIQFLPQINVDGYDLSRTEGHRLWRKNTHGEFGVDINRNFSSHFGEEGISTDPKSDIYGGPKEASEPETQCLERFISKTGPFLGVMDFHCYQDTLGFPLCYTQTSPRNFESLQECARIVSKAIEAVNGTKYTYGQVSKMIYPCSGTMIDFCHEFGYSQYSFANELDGNQRWFGADGFLTNPRNIIPIGEESFAGFKAFASYALKNSTKAFLRPAFNALSLPVKAAERQKVPVELYSAKGIENRGNSCFFNSVIQCFGAIKSLHVALKSDLVVGNRTDPFVGDLTHVLCSFWKNENMNLAKADFPKSVDNLLDRLFSLGSSFRKNEMADSSEFALKCVEQIRSANSTSSAKKLFDGQIEYVVGADRIAEPFFHLALPLQSNTIQRSLTDYFAPTVMGTELTPHYFITKYPRILLVTSKIDPSHLKAKGFSFPEELDLSPFRQINYNEPHTSFKYRLCGYVTYHSLGNDCGHYTATIRQPSGGWLEASDSSVRKAALPRDAAGHFHCNAHVLFYELGSSAQHNLLY